MRRCSSLAIPFAMALLSRARTWPWRILWGVSLAMLVIGCIATEEKTAFILLVATVAIMVVSKPRRYVKWWPLLIVAVLLTRVVAPHSISVAALPDPGPGQIELDLGTHHRLPGGRPVPRHPSAVRPRAGQL